MKNIDYATNVTIELKPTLVEIVKKVMKKPKATANQIAKYVTGLLEEEVALQEQIRKNKNSCEIKKK